MMTDSLPPVDPEIAKALEDSFNDGVKQGRQEMFNLVLQWLENRYVKHPKRPKRGSQDAKNLLRLVKDLTKYMRDVMK